MDAEPEQTRPWNEPEVERLVRLVGEGIPLPEICRRLGRTRVEVDRELFFLCLAPPSSKADPPERHPRR